MFRDIFAAMKYFVTEISIHWTVLLRTWTSLTVTVSIAVIYSLTEKELKPNFLQLR